MINKKGQIYCIDFIKDFKSTTKLSPTTGKRNRSINLLPSTDLDNKSDPSLLIKEDENEKIRRSRAASNLIDTKRQDVTNEVIIEDIDNENEDERLLQGSNFGHGGMRSGSMGQIQLVANNNTSDLPSKISPLETRSNNDDTELVIQSNRNSSRIITDSMR